MQQPPPILFSQQTNNLQNCQHHSLEAESFHSVTPAV